jgi:hypothetical protein
VLPLVNPWFADPVDKAVLLTGINEVISTVNTGVLFLFCLGIHEKVNLVVSSKLVLDRSEFDHDDRHRLW